MWGGARCSVRDADHRLGTLVGGYKRKRQRNSHQAVQQAEAARADEPSKAEPSTAEADAGSSEAAATKAPPSPLLLPTQVRSADRGGSAAGRSTAALSRMLLASSHRPHLPSPPAEADTADARSVVVHVPPTTNAPAPSDQPDGEEAESVVELLQQQLAAERDVSTALRKDLERLQLALRSAHSHSSERKNRAESL